MRTAIYIDGFNLYYGAIKGTPYKWLDLRLLCENILKPHHKIVSIVYCTAKMRSTPTDPDAPARQATYLKALRTHIPEINIVYGHFLKKEQRYRPVDSRLGPWVDVVRMEEKGSDVNLAVHLVNDARTDGFDCAVVVSNDSDLAEAMRIVKDECGKQVGLFTPTRLRTSKHLTRHSHFQRTIRKGNLARSQLPSPIPGTQITRPQ